MNEEAKQALAEMLQRMVEGIDGAVAFSQQQIPDVVEQLLLWHMTHSLIGFATGLILFSAGVLYCTYVATRKPIKGESTAWFFMNGQRTGNEFSVMLTLFPIAFGFPLAALNLGWLQILIAPKLYLLEYAADLVK